MKAPFDLAIGVFREADGARRANALQPRGDVDTIAHQVAIDLLDDVAQMNADAEFDPSFGEHARVALDHRVLHLDGAA